MANNIYHQKTQTQVMLSADEAFGILGLLMISIILSHAFGRAAKK